MSNKTYDKDLLESIVGGLLGTVGGLLGASYDYYVYDETGTLVKISDPSTGLTYDAANNYIVFRDIDLSATGDRSNNKDDDWTPLMFSGTMLGAKAPAGAATHSLWDVVKNPTTANRPAISHVNVNQTADIDVSAYVGVGFFATITNEVNASDIGVSAGTVSVKNLELNNVAVSNSATATKSTDTILNALTSGLGWLVGGLTDLLVGVVTIGSVKLNLKDMLSGLLNARAKDPTIFATGSFAGRVVGDVEISDCAVTGKVSVSSQKDRVGGFVGYTEGVTQYDGLSDALGITANVLSSLLNAIPGLGLGDVITVLLDNALPVGSLIPTGYINPHISSCSLMGLTSTVGLSTTDYNGGFVGQQVGTVIEGCTVDAGSYDVQAKSFGGGFAGVSRDADIKGLLSSVGVELVRGMQPQSMLLGCSISQSSYTVKGGSYLGGFTGAQANSYAVNCSVSGTASIAATGNYAGGFSGIATVGWLTNLGKDNASNNSLLKVVGKLLEGLLSSNPDQAGMLLSLVGISPSAILGCQITCTSLEVSAGDSYAGGIIGAGDGVYLAESSQTYLEKLPYWKYPASGSTGVGAVTQRSNDLSGLASVSAGADRAGGIAGSVTTAHVGGLLNGTLGLGGFLGFTVRNVTVSGVAGGFTVSATGNYAGGALGEAVGGEAYEVHVNNLASVTASNRAGGFVGCAGPGDLAGSDGLGLNLLGLDGLLKLTGLLSVAEGVSVSIQEASVSGVAAGFTVEATGANAQGETAEFVAGGFIGKSNSTQVENAHASNLASVRANADDGNAGGFVGTSETGGLADVADTSSIAALVNAQGLLGAIDYLIPSYTTCDVTYVDNGFVAADTAGGFAGDFQSGTVDNAASTVAGAVSPYAVYNLAAVNGGAYAGGFGGRVYSGALADSAGGLSILGGSNVLGINAADLAKVAQAYVPSVANAGVKSDNGFTVRATTLRDLDATSGSAGGFIGYGSGVQVSNCDVTKLKNTAVSEPADLEGVDGSSYFGNASAYAVDGGRYAGGFVGKMDVGSAASLGGGLKVLGTSIALTDVLSALNVVVSTIEHSDVTGTTGGFAVRANATVAATGDTGIDMVGRAGGFVGSLEGGHIQDSNSYNFSYIIGQVSAGGYAGTIEPGAVASVLGDDTSDSGVLKLLGGLASTSGSLLSLAEDFVPTVRNSETTCIPCGGAVRAQASSDAATLRGTAGGYVGHNEGGNIWGNNSAAWKDATPGATYTGTRRTCAAERIRSVYGAEYAGGFTGLMECSDTADTGSLSLLFGLVSANNVLGALSVTYPTEENTQVTGPLAGMSLDSWNGWVSFVGQNGGYGQEFAGTTFTTQEALDAFLKDYVYGYNVAAGRTTFENEANKFLGGCAGGYVGAMHSGVVTNGQASDAKLVSAMRAAGGFAGEMLTGGAANLGSVKLFGTSGLGLDLGKMLGAVQVFVPTVKDSSVTGYRSGLSVAATGSADNGCGNAGGYVGSGAGAQIWGDGTTRAIADDDNNLVTNASAAAGCNVSNLRLVQGRNAVGGFAGRLTAGSVVNADTNASDGFLQSVLDTVISTGNAASVLEASMSTVRNAHVSASDEAWGFVVDGAYAQGNTTAYAKHAGGFVGLSEAAVLGDDDGTYTVEANGTSTSQPSELAVDGLRGVSGGQFAGGFVGLADVTGVATVGDSAGTSVLKSLIEAGQASVLDAFRSYVYHAKVNGVSDGFQVRAYDEGEAGTLSETRYTGDAGGFAGGLLNGSVKDSQVTNLNAVSAKSYAGGFVGYLGKSGTVDVDSAAVLKKLGLADLTAGVLDVWGSHVEDCSVMGIAAGFSVDATGAANDPLTAVSARAIAGGFAGPADLSKIKGCTAGNLKRVFSTQIAGGFAGETAMNYVANTQVDSKLVAIVLAIVNALVKLLYLDKAQQTGILNISIPGFDKLGELLGLKVLSDGDLLYVNLLGLKIGVALSKDDPDYPGSDAAIITIGDSTIKLPCDKNGLTDTNPNLELTLIKGNRTNIASSTVTGVAKGYDVFGGGASDAADGTDTFGYAGGFLGLNNEGVCENDQMVYCDTIRGATDLVGPFTGKTLLKSTYEPLSKVSSIEGTGNAYSVYRAGVSGATDVKGSAGAGALLNSATEIDTPTSLVRYVFDHLKPVNTYNDLKDAVIEPTAGSAANNQALDAYVSPAKAVLMLDVPVAGGTGGLTPEPSEGQDPCEVKVDLTIQKVWNDYGDADKLRPSTIDIALFRSYTTADGTTVIQMYVRDAASGTYEWHTYAAGGDISYDITLTKADDASDWSETWRKVVSGLDVAFADADGTLHYYTYTVQEKPVDGYSTTYEYSANNANATDKYVATVTNTHLPALPDTGGMGMQVLAALGLLLLLVGAAAALHRSRRRAPGEVVP